MSSKPTSNSSKPSPSASDNSLSQFDQDFAHAMALKLRLSREKKQKVSEASPPSSEPSETKEEMIFDRSEILALALNTGLRKGELFAYSGST